MNQMGGCPGYGYQVTTHMDSLTSLLSFAQDLVKKYQKAITKAL